jgi:polygalacturonase
MKTRTLAVALMLFLTSMAAFAVSTATFNIETYGAVPNDSTDDKTAIQAAIDAAYANGGGDVFVPAGTYDVSDSLHLKTKVRLRGVGSGSIIKAMTAANIVMIEQATDAEVRDLKLDGGGHTGSGVRIIGSSHCIVDNVVVTGIGGTSSSPGGSFISVEAYEPGDSHNPFSGNTLQASRNQVRNCMLDDNVGLAMFGITLTTRWEAALSATRTAFNDNNVISGNTIIGFRWNSIEIAGPATIGNTISNNIAVNHRGYSAIEADKGASYNTFTGNVVRKFQITECGSFGCPTAYRAQKGDADNGDFHIAKGNVFTGNVFEGLGSLSGGAGMYLDGASDTVVSGNEFNVTGASGAETYGVETNLAVDRAQITGNIIRGAKYGVGNLSQSFATPQRDITVASNTIEASHYGVAFLTTTDTSGIYENLVVRDNTIRGALQYFGVIFGLGINKSVVQSNRMTVPSQGVLIAGDDNMVLSNSIDGMTTATYGIRINNSAAERTQTFGNVVVDVAASGGLRYSNGGGTTNIDKFNSWN